MYHDISKMSWAQYVLVDQALRGRGTRCPEGNSRLNLLSVKNIYTCCKAASSKSVFQKCFQTAMKTRINAYFHERNIGTHRTLPVKTFSGCSVSWGQTQKLWFLTLACSRQIEIPQSICFLLEWRWKSLWMCPSHWRAGRKMSHRTWCIIIPCHENDGTQTDPWAT